uniref:Uncharacterized protein n=1 Tax=Cafeteria roenbergensis TaxID=33653 RepID=A0A7S0JY03_CAFRO
MFLAHPTGMLAHIEESLVAMVPEGITSESAEVLAEVVAGGFFAALVKAPLHCDPAMEWRVIRSLAADLHPGATSRAFPLFAGAKAESIRRKASVAADDALTLSPEWTAFAHNLALQLEKRLVPGASMEAVQPCSNPFSDRAMARDTSNPFSSASVTSNPFGAATTVKGSIRSGEPAPVRLKRAMSRPGRGPSESSSSIGRGATFGARSVAFPTEDAPADPFSASRGRSRSRSPGWPGVSFAEPEPVPARSARCGAGYALFGSAGPSPPAYEPPSRPVFGRSEPVAPTGVALTPPMRPFGAASARDPASADAPTSTMFGVTSSSRASGPFGSAAPAPARGASSMLNPFG